MIVSKKSLGVAVLHFVTAGVMLCSAIYIILFLALGGFSNLPDTGDDSQNIANGLAAVFTIICLIPSAVGVVLSIPSFIFSGVKLCKQAQGELPSKKSFIVTLTLKTIGFLLLLPVLLFAFDAPGALPTAILHIVMLALSLASSLLEAYVRRKP